jgi:serine/threonine-protein kinase
MSDVDWQRPTALHKAGLVGQRLGNYEVRALVGSGSMGDVYAAEHPEIGKKVAIKVLKAGAEVEREQVERMLLEARAVNAIRHPAIVDVFDFGRLPDGRPYLVMDFVEGEPLDVLLRRSAPLPANEVVELIAALCAPLSAAHAKGILHRDLKPANVYVSDVAGTGRQVRLLDFGLARYLEPGPDRLTRAGVVVGTPDYLAPEQAALGDLSAASDLYALGVIAFELLTGQLPFRGPDVRELISRKLTDEPPRVSSRVPSVPPYLDQLVFEMMARVPTHRPASADVVRERLLSKREVKPPRPSPRLPPPPKALSSIDPKTELDVRYEPRKRPGSRGLVALIVVGALVACGAVASVLVANNQAASLLAPPPATPIIHESVAPPPAPPEPMHPVEPIKPAVHPAPMPKAEAKKQKVPLGGTSSAIDPPVTVIDRVSMLDEIGEFQRTVQTKYVHEIPEIEDALRPMIAEVKVATNRSQLIRVREGLQMMRRRYP